MNDKKWKRNCPKCGEELYYSQKSGFNRAIKNNSKCLSCSHKKGKINNCLECNNKTSNKKLLKRLNPIKC